MSLNSTPQSIRVHIGLFGKRNAGKSSVINAITNQSAAIVSDIAGTTTDPVFRPMEILPIGPCVLIDTAGLDDVGELGELRISKSLDILEKTDIALLVVDCQIGVSKEDLSLIEKFNDKNIPHILVLNKIDTIKNQSEILSLTKNKVKCPVVSVSSTDKIGIEDLKNEIIKVLPKDSNEFKLVSDLIEPNDLVVLVVPIDKAAPKGRLILPQQQVIRDILDTGAISIVTKEDNLKETLSNLSKKPKLVITDSQVFPQVDKDTPKDIPLTSFSILFARQKGDLKELIDGAYALENLKDGDKVLMAEGCTHHRQTDDIGTVKIPNMIRKKTGKNITFEFSSGVSFTEDITKYALVVHCGACMMNRAGMLSRIEKAKSFNVPIVNYGILIAYTKGILERSLELFNY
ncbi:MULTISPECIES: [FeFe] hydrogenase H-cluster maturation GTPase HydF [unclassified Clostridioides]|uniref:[FeFe] hydrogenase H-cluster maturation GTPase HydF n=1 Tax=unclassified Clostridioides TaxID=2635829 RepID=UPI001D114DB8|nr:[FeFe] hydrogenase H-cluster maturation GTPase HydF [Clostridioides sp. ZZV15-6388]MCC0665228.1 [FeFe] hydrogenase H-cluster maturation GTPase HydF [Clostridioides sp. ZZV15-6597]MCC0668839.1 [FeFe] hydrogenase H-cluster maturation GTPase HydF [Clostridioides sp. ZZV14-6153]MCC0719725.1 [FeFe] hydrogenase H-cluster maturation GTPase HydF [Clostridioides sp. ZZV14-6105]MCC0725122.1 [FeFe] hydrogenase H-cluster maturation GTPase HydF [Clostridioides sp. ZZV14-6045]MCC0731872.1 [FeFe] hydrogen